MGLRQRGALVRRVSKNLASTEQASLFEHNGFKVYVVPSFLPSWQCAHIRNLILAKNERSGTLGDDRPIFSDFRTSSTSHLASADDIVEEIEQRISNLLGIGNDTAESTQGQLYQVGETFKPHFDYFDPQQRHWKRASKEGGQRVWTAMVYLNDDFEGGETRFTEANFFVRPKTGTLLIWNNMEADGQPNLSSMHEGAPVTRGEKMIITRWYRERVWKPWHKLPRDQNAAARHVEIG